MQVLVAAALATATLAVAGVSPAPARAADGSTTIYLFWGDGCPHCAALEPFLQELAERPGVELAAYEVWYDQANRDLFTRVSAAHGFEPSGVPTVFVGGRAWVGDSPALREAIAAIVDVCATGSCPDVAGAVLRGDPPTPAPTTPSGPESETVLTLPLLGSHDVGADSLVWATVLIAFVDGFNPCSLWVLTVLLAMILRTGSRRRLALIGGVYVGTAALVYGLFLVGLFGALTVVDYSWWLRTSVALVALGIALVNVKDYFWLGRGISFSIPDRAKPSIVRESRSLALEERRLPVVLGSTVALAAGVALLELPCTVGFPVVWSNLLADRGVSTAGFAFLLAVYLLVFLVDEVAVVAAAVAAMRIGRLQERHGKALKLGAGVLMGLLAIVMLVDPSLLEHVAGAGAVLGAAAVITLVIVAVHDQLASRPGRHVPGASA